MIARLRGLLIGAGTWGEVISASLQTVPGIQLCGVHDVSAESADRIARRWNVQRSEDDWSNYDVALIATPNATHEELCLVALNRGLDVICEKPLTEDVQSTNHVLKTAHNRGRSVKVVYEHRSWPWVPALKQLITSRRLGSIHNVHAHYSTSRALDPSPNDWRWDARSSPLGAMAQLGTHLVDLLDYLFGSAKPVTSAIIRTERGAHEASAILRLAGSGPLASLTTSYLGPALMQLFLSGTKGHATLGMNLTAWPDFMTVGNTATLAVDDGTSTLTSFSGSNALRQTLSQYVQEILHGATPEQRASEEARLVRVATVLERWGSAVSA